MSDPIAPHDSDRGGGENKNQPQTLKADLALQGTITIPQGTQPATSSNHPDPDNRRRDPIGYRYSVIGTFAFSAALVIVGALQFWIYTRQAKIMNNQTRIAANQLKFAMDVESALVIIDDIHFPDIEPRATPGTFVISLKNGGRSVAIVSELLALPTYHLSGKPLPEKPDYFVPPMGNLIAPPIFPNTSQMITAVGGDSIVTMPGFDKPPQITPEERLARVKSGDVPIDIYGFVKYKTGSETDKRERISGYCYRYTPLAKRAAPNLQFTVCDNPNYTYVH